MATKLNVKIDQYAFNKINKLAHDITILPRPVNNTCKKTTKKIGEGIVRTMKKRVYPFSPSGPLYKGIIGGFVNETETTHQYRITSNAKHSSKVEFGVKPHFVPFTSSPEFFKWAKEHNKLPKGYRKDSRKNRGLLIGGRRSRIKLGNSKRAFFYSSIDKYFKKNPSRAQYAKAIKEEVRKIIRGK